MPPFGGHRRAAGNAIYGYGAGQGQEAVHRRDVTDAIACACETGREVVLRYAIVFFEQQFRDHPISAASSNADAACGWR
jgi:hypothetical protein